MCLPIKLHIEFIKYELAFRISTK